VVALAGDARAEEAGCEGQVRSLVCSALLFEGDRVITAAGGRLEFLAKNLRGRMDPDSELNLGLTRQDAPDLALVRGRVRVTDERGDAALPPHRLTTPDAQSLTRGSDTELAIGVDLQGPYATFCESRISLDLRRVEGSEHRMIQPGECALVRPHAAMVVIASRERERAMANLAQCDVNDVIGDANERFDPSDVAARGAGFEPGPPSQLDPSADCTVGGLCSSSPPDTPPPVTPPVAPPRPPPVVESPPVFRPPPGLPIRSTP
jgi:hypothetical protein